MINSTISGINSPVRSIEAKVELYSGSTLTDTFYYTDRLISFEIERYGEEGKFFGFGICQKLVVQLIDLNRLLDITTSHTLKVYLGINGNYVSPYPTFYVSECRRKENDNQLQITAYDALFGANKHIVADLDLIDEYSIADFARAGGAALGKQVILEDNPAFNTTYPEGANFDGTEALREALDDVAEATQTIYYIDSAENLVFKTLDKDGEAVMVVGKNLYISLDSKTNRRLAKIVSATELGDNVGAQLEVSGTTQYVRDNAFWALRTDIAALVDDALSYIGGLTINQFDMEWRGNFLLEIGDKIGLVAKDNSVFYSYILNDKVSYNGFFSESTSWKYPNNEDETADNPTSLGEVLNKTFARVDKANREIEIVASEAEANAERISSLYINTESINASVQSVENSLNNNIQAVNGEINNLTNRVNASMTAEDVRLEIETELENGVGKVITSTGFTFDETGLTISKSGSEMETTITEDGMKVYRDNMLVLTANNIGVDATNLHATTYLIIGTHSRIEDWGNRTACFWIS